MPLIRIPALFHDPGIDTSDGRLSDAYRVLAEKKGCRFADALDWDCALAHDGVHLSKEGHRRFAACFLSEFCIS